MTEPTPETPEPTVTPDQTPVPVQNDVPETVEYTEEEPLELPSGSKVWHKDGKTYREDSTGSVYVAGIEFADEVKVLADLYPDLF